MQAFTIKSSWVALAPKKRLDVEYWAGVTRHIRDLGVDPDEATEADVRRAMSNLVGEAMVLREAASTLRTQARQIDAEARAVESRIPKGVLE
jgi:hypothetical protein